MKQVIVVNEQLKLPRGKLSAQVAHASVAGFLSASPECRSAWLESGMPKVVLAAASEEEVVQCHEAAEKSRLAVYLIEDAGRTVVAAGTVTCVGIGPAADEEIDKITGHLKLVR